jgi:tetratricopeptide (TPR) repeat protein
LNLLLNFVVSGYANQDSLVVSSYLKAAEKDQISNPDTALKLADKAYKVALKSGDPLLLVNPYQTFASIYYYSGNQQLALDYYFKALKQLEENTLDKELPNYVRTTAKIYCNIGNCYFDLKMVEMALAQYKKSLSLIDETNRQKPGVFTPRHKMLLMHNIGNILASKKEYELAKKYYLMAQEINRTVNDIQVKAGLLESLGLILLKEGRSEEALGHFNQALEVRNKVHDIRGITGTYLFIGDYYLKQHKELQANEWYLKAMSLGKQSARWQLVQIAADTLTQLFLKVSDFSNPYNCYSVL